MATVVAKPGKDASTTSGLKARQLVLFSLLTVIATIALLELSLRLLAIGAALWNARAHANVQSKYLDHPFLTTTMLPNYREVVADYPEGGDLIFETNSFGFRGAGFEVERPAGVYRIVVVGGSAVLTGRTNADLFTALLEDLLAEQFEGVSFEVINAGVPGYTSLQELLLIETQVLEWNPNLVLIYDGRNDMFEASMPEYVPYWNRRNQEVVAFLQGRESIWRKHLFTVDLLARHLLQREMHPERDYNTARGRNHAYRAHRAALDVYATNLEVSLVVLEGFGVQGALAFQPTLLTTNKPRSQTEERIFAALDDSFVAAQTVLLPAAAARMAEVADRHAAQWVDLSGVFDAQAETMFIDDVHQTDAGNVLIAQALLEALVPAIRTDLSN